MGNAKSVKDVLVKTSEHVLVFPVDERDMHRNSVLIVVIYRSWWTNSKWRLMTFWVYHLLKYLAVCDYWALTEFSVCCSSDCIDNGISKPLRQLITSQSCIYITFVSLHSAEKEGGIPIIQLGLRSASHRLLSGKGTGSLIIYLSVGHKVELGLGKFCCPWTTLPDVSVKIEVHFNAWWLF